MKTTLAIAAAFALLGTGAAFATPSLKGDITVSTDIVTVGDMFDDAGTLATTGIFRAPAPGTTGIVALADVQRAASLVGLSTFDNVGYTRIRVVRTATTIDAAFLDRLIDQNLAKRGVIGGDVSADIHFDLANIGFSAADVAEPASLADLRYVPETGAFAARFSIAGIDQPVDLSGNIQLMTTAPRLIDTQPAGTVLAPGDFEMAPVPLSTADAGNFAAIDQLVGKQLVRPSRAGMMLKATDVTEPTVVTRNTAVTVMLRTGAMTLTVRGQSLTTAGAGEPVDVMNTVTHKILHGIARPDGSVEITTAIASL